MNTPLIFAVVYLAMIANSFWEAYVEGGNRWDKGKCGWKIKIYKNYLLTGYHFYLFFVMWPLLLSLPLFIYGWNFKLFGVLLSAYLSGLIIEDFVWYLVNPVVKFSEFNSKNADCYPWVKIGKFEIPLGYPLLLLFSILSWYFIWR